MIPRYLRITYWILVGGIATMVLLLAHGCQHKRQRIEEMRDESRIPAPTDLPAEVVSIAQANDADDSILLNDTTMPVPEDQSLRARIILARMLTNFTLPASTHPVPSVPGVTDVFFLPLPVVNSGNKPDPNSPAPTPQATPYGTTHLPGSQLAVVNLTKVFADAHPSGILAEDLTLRAIIATLHANFPQIEQVRFLVDGETRSTLAGHADLTHPYSIDDPTQAIHPLSPTGNTM
jgi:hypothetical protein